jgi:hypothetical protein
MAVERDSFTLKQVRKGGKTRIVNLSHSLFGEDIDIDAVLRIDYSNIYAEVASMPVVMMRFGRLRAEAESMASRAKLEMGRVKGSRYEHFSNTLKSDKGRAPSIPQVNAAIDGDDQYQNAAKAYIRANRIFSDLDSIYWSCKSKEKSLNKIMESMTLSPESFDKEILEDYFNEVLIRSERKSKRDNK